MPLPLRRCVLKAKNEQTLRYSSCGTDTDDVLSSGFAEQTLVFFFVLRSFLLGNNLPVLSRE